MNTEIVQAILSLGSALLLTILIEAAVAWLIGLRTWRGQLTLLLINVITNPTLNIIINLLAYFHIHAMKSPFDPLLVALELAVTVSEAILLRLALDIPPKKAVVLSIAINTVSYLAGVWILWH
jgi:hypothetical protein